MPHIGKYVPWLLKNQVVEGVGTNFTFYRPPSRKILAVFNALGNAGSAAIQWSGLTVLSNVGDYWADDSRWTIYTFTNPNNSNLTISMRWLYRQIPNGAGIGVGHYDCVTRHEDGGAFVAEDESLWQYGEPWVRPSFRVSIGPNWTDDPNPSLQSALGFRMRSATWDEQPDYHPYRH